MAVAPKTIEVYLVIKNWVTGDGWPISAPTIEIAYQSRERADAYVKRHGGDERHPMRVQTLKVEP